MAFGRPAYLHTRLWPPRWLLEARHVEVMQALEDLSSSQGRLRGAIEALDSRVGHIEYRQAEVMSRIRRTQALAARAYEATQRWPERLAAAREREDYELAYSDPDPLLSIPIPTYHSPDTLVDLALASVRAQTHENWEAIVVGDRCTDDTERRVKAIGDPRIRWHNLPAREPDPDDPFERWAVKGTIPRAVGMDMARGRWIAPLSHDDAWDPDHLEVLLAAAREHRAEIAYSRMRAVDSHSPDGPSEGSVGAWPPRSGQWNCQAAMFHAALEFVRPDRACALASEPNDWNLARRAWQAGVRFHFVDRETATLYVYPRWEKISAEYHEMGLPLSAVAAP
jgi:hypothetical protein